MSLKLLLLFLQSSVNLFVYPIIDLPIYFIIQICPPVCHREGQYHSNKENLAKGWTDKILQSGKMLGREKDMIRALDLEASARALDDARIEPQTTSRQEPIAARELVDQLVRELGLLGRQEHRSDEHGISNQLNCVGKTDAVRVLPSELCGFTHESTQGIMSQQKSVELLKDANGIFADQRLLSQALMLFDLINDQLDLPSLIIEFDKVQGRSLHGVEQGGDQAVDLVNVGIGGPTGMLAMGSRHLLQERGRLRKQPIGITRRVSGSRICGSSLLVKVIR